MRLNLMVHGQDAVGRDLVKSDRWGVAGAIGFGLGTGTVFTLNYLHQQDDRIPDYGVPTLTPPGETYSRPVTETTSIDRSTFYGFTRDYDKTSADIVTSKLQHTANSWLALYNDTRVGVYGRDFAATRVSCNAASGCLDALFDNDPSTIPLFTPGNAASATGPYGMSVWGIQDIMTAVVATPIGGLRNQLVGGIDASYLSSKRRFYAFSETRPGRNAYDPDHCFAYTIVPNTTPTAVDNSFAEGRDYAVFATDQLWLTDAWSVVVGGRLDKYAIDYQQITVDNTASERSTSATLFNPKASLVFEPSETQTYYFSWARSATPQGTSVTNQPTPVSATESPGGVATRDLEPEENEIFEAGAKVGLLENKLGLQGSIFRVMKNNAKLDDGLGNIVSSGDAQHIQGIEFGATGTLGENWAILANYTYLDGKTEDSTNAAAVGGRVANVPEHSAALWTTFRPMDRLTIGGGITYAGEIFLNSANTTIAPESFTLDGLISYEIGKWRIALNLSNLTDRLNYSGSQNGRVVPAAGRTVILSIGVVY